MKVKQKIKEEPNLEVGKLKVEDIKKEDENLTAEDEERRRRRRDRNKVAATKCRNKKKERTTLLIAEGEVLEIQNSSFKEELIRLEVEKRRLKEILAEHEHTCAKRPRIDKEKDPNKEQKNIFKVPNTPTPKEYHQTPPKIQKVESFDTARKYPAYNRDIEEQQTTTDKFQYLNYCEEFNDKCGDNVLNGNNMFVKQEDEQPSTLGQAPGYYHYSYYGANIKNNFLDSQSLSLSSYGFNSVDNMCVAL